MKSKTAEIQYQKGLSAFLGQTGYKVCKHKWMTIENKEWYAILECRKCKENTIIIRKGGDIND